MQGEIVRQANALETLVLALVYTRGFYRSLGISDGKAAYLYCHKKQNHLYQQYEEKNQSIHFQAKSESLL